MRRRPSPLWLPTEALLLEGGDDRIAPGSDGRNRYGCRPVPDGILAAFGSSTASSISEQAFAAADRLRRHWLAEALASSSARLQGREAGRIVSELKELCGLADIDGLQVALAASGTDLHRLALRHAAGDGGEDPVVVMMAASETGSGVAAALAPSRRAAAPTPEAPPLQVAVRRVDGSPRPAGHVEAEVEALATRAIAAGCRVLLVGLDLSKTGLQVPDPVFLSALRERWPGRLDVLIDACQFRLSNATLRRHLEAGFQVAVTGSKFFTGPSFCGALFLPRSSCRPRLVPATADGTCLPSFGLMLRWEAALAEMRRWSQLSPAVVRRVVDAFAAAVTERLDGDRAFERLATPPPDRGPFADAWDAVPTIFPFLLRHDVPGGALRLRPATETEAVYRSSIEALPGIQLGQPVRCGERAGTPVSALRLCLSARLIVEAAGDGHTDGVIARALDALDRLARIDPSVRPSTLAPRPNTCSQRSQHV